MKQRALVGFLVVAIVWGIVLFWWPHHLGDRNRARPSNGDHISRAGD